MIIWLNSILQTKTFGIYLNLKLNCLSVLQTCRVFLILIKNKLIDSYYKLINRLDNNNIIILTLISKIFFKVNKALVDYQMIFFAKV